MFCFNIWIILFVSVLVINSMILWWLTQSCLPTVRCSGYTRPSSKRTVHSMSSTSHLTVNIVILSSSLGLTAKNSWILYTMTPLAIVYTTIQKIRSGKWTPSTPIDMKRSTHAVRSYIQMSHFLSLCAGVVCFISWTSLHHVSSYFWYLSLDFSCRLNQGRKWTWKRLSYLHSLCFCWWLVKQCHRLQMPFLY